MRHHTPLILLGGWLLMTAPLVEDPATPSGFRLRLDAPIIEWVQDSAHDTAKSCEAMKYEEFQEALTHHDKSSTDMYLRARCVPAEHIYLPKAQR